MKLLSPRVHGYLDYAAVIALSFGPTLFGFGRTTAGMICYVIAAALLVMSLLTAYPLGIKRVIPFTTHGGVELVVTLVFLLSPWLLRFWDQVAARNFYLVAGVALGIVYLMTDYRAADIYRTEPRGIGERKPTYG
jgi:hypothetical protein